MPRLDAKAVRKREWERIERIKEAGLGRFIVDRSTHPGFYVSAWPANLGHETLGAKTAYRHGSLNHNSVLVSVISNEYCEGVWWRLQDMLAFTESKGFTIALQEQDDMSMMPTDAIGIMRACAAQQALDAGFEWCFMLDTDVHMKPDTLVRLIDSDRPVVYPLVVDKEDRYLGAPVSAPKLRPGMGLQPVFWACMSAMLFNTKVFNCLDAYAWHGHDRHFSECLAHYGHRIYVDTDTVVEAVRGPSRHPSKTWEQLWADLGKAHDRRQTQDRDRRPPPDFDPAFSKGVVDRDGVYWALDKWKYSGVRGPVNDEQAAQQEAEWREWEAEKAKGSGARQ